MATAEDPETTTLSPELARALGRRGGLAGGGKWFNSLSESQKRAHIRRMVVARRKKRAERR